MEETTLKQYKGTKTVKAEPMNEYVAVEKGFARANKDGTNGEKAITSSTSTQMAVHTIPGPQKMCSRSRTR